MLLTKGNIALTVEEAERFSAIMAFSVRNAGSLDFSTCKEGPCFQEKLEALAGHLNIEASGIITCRQIHGDDIFVAESPPEIQVEADAIVSLKAGIFPAVKTADCVPVLLLDPVRRISAAVHVGWRGAVLRILRKVLVALETRFGSRPADLIAALGPAIGACCYEVDDKVLTPLGKAIPQAERFVTTACSGNEGPARESKRIDLVAVNRYELVSRGVPDRNIYSADMCTSCRQDLFFSYRRDGSSGRHIAVAGFRPV